MSHYSISSPIGNVGIHINNHQLTGIDFLDEYASLEPAKSSEDKKIINELMRYFEGKIVNFSLSYTIQGTPFQERVWKALLNIPYGSVITYGELAKKLKTSARGIGVACRTNPLPIVIPCHRVVGANSLVGYNGDTKGVGLKKKSWLIEHEKKFKKLDV